MKLIYKYCRIVKKTGKKDKKNSENNFGNEEGENSEKFKKDLRKSRTIKHDNEVIFGIV